MALINPVILLQLNIRQPQDYFVLDSAGIWKYSTLSNIYAGIDSEITENMPVLKIVGIGDVSVNGLTLPEITTFTNTIDGRAIALSAEPSFLFDGENDVLYLRCDNNYNPPLIYNVQIGAIFAYADKPYFDYVNDVNYLPDLKGIPKLKNRKDAIFFEQLKFDSIIQEINNADYRNDDKRTSNLFGSLAEYYVGDKDQEFSEFTKIYDARVTQYKFDRESLYLTMRDARKTLQNRIPVNYIDPDVYTDAEEYADSTPAPILYGAVTDVPCISLDEQADPIPANYRFLFADASVFDYDVSSAVAKVDGIVIPGATINGTTGLISIPAADYTPGKQVTYTGFGIIDNTTTLFNQLDIVKHLLVNYAGIVYNSNNFNITEYEAEKLKAPDIGIAIYQNTTVIDVLQQIAATTAAGFIRQGNGLFTWRTFDSAADPVIQIRNSDWLQYPQLTGNVDEVLTSATVKYDQSYSSGKWKRATDSSQEGIVKGKFNISKNKEFDSLYITSNAALLFAADIMSRSSSVREIVTAAIPLSFIGETEIGKNAEIEFNHVDNTEFVGVYKAEILEVNPDVRTQKIFITFRLFEELAAFTDLAPNGGIVTENDVFFVLEDGTTFFIEEGA
jgi:hypothetical protein